MYQSGLADNPKDDMQTLLKLNILTEMLGDTWIESMVCTEDMPGSSEEIRRDQVS